MTTKEVFKNWLLMLELRSQDVKTLNELKRALNSFVKEIDKELGKRIDESLINKR